MMHGPCVGASLLAKRGDVGWASARRQRGSGHPNPNWWAEAERRPARLTVVQRKLCIQGRELSRSSVGWASAHRSGPQLASTLRYCSTLLGRRDER
jgi:hypothetical protein